MKWPVLSFLFCISTLQAGEDSLKPPQLTWDEAVTASQTRKHISPDGREWEFRFHGQEVPLPQNEQYVYSLRIASSKLQDYDTKTLFAAYDVLRKGKDDNGSIPTFFGTTFYLMQSAQVQK